MFDLIKKIIDFLNNLDNRNPGNNGNGSNDPITIDANQKAGLKKAAFLFPIILLIFALFSSF